MTVEPPVVVPEKTLWLITLILTAHLGPIKNIISFQLLS